MTRRAVVTLAAVALAAGVFVSGPEAAQPLCGSKQCAQAIAAACGSLSGADFRACKNSVIDQCKISGETFCSCTDPTLPACGQTTTTTSTTSSTTTSSTTSTTTTLPIPTNPCAGDCDGACGPDEECAYARPVCACAPTPACGGTGGGTCGGNCPLGSSGPCHFDTSNGFCLCEGTSGCGLKGSACTAQQDC